MGIGRLEGGRASYYDHGQIAAPFGRLRAGCAEAGGRFGKEQFEYDATSDTYRCPKGYTLSRETAWLKRGEPHMAYANPEACRSGALKAQCTTGACRRLTRWEGEAIVEARPARVAVHPEVIAQRKAIVEHPFESIKFCSPFSARKAR